MILIKYHKHETSKDTIHYLLVYSVPYSFQHSALVKVLSDFKPKWSSHLIYLISNTISNAILGKTNTANIDVSLNS